MDVHPSSAVNPPGPTTDEPFAPEALYEIKIDTDGDAIADITYQVSFTSLKNGAQTATLRLLEGDQAAKTGDGGRVIVETRPVENGAGPAGTGLCASAMPPLCSTRHHSP